MCEDNKWDEQKINKINCKTSQVLWYAIYIGPSDHTCTLTARRINIKLNIHWQQDVSVTKFNIALESHFAVYDNTPPRP